MRDMMQTLEFRGPGQLALAVRARISGPGPGEVTLRPTLVGVCGTDRGIVLGTYPCAAPRILGHEAIGVVESAGAGVTRLHPGDRVVLDPTQSCLQCDRCAKGETSFCRNKSRHEIGVGCDGALAEQLVVPSRALHKIPEGMPDRRAVLIEPLACVLTAVRRAGLAPDDQVLVIGAGPMGLIAALLAQRLAASVLIAEIDPYRREHAGILLNQEQPLTSPGDSHSEFSLVIDTVGTMCGSALKSVGDGGRVLLLGCDSQAQEGLRQFDLTGRCISLIGSCDYHNSDFPRAIEFMSSFGCDEIVTHTFPLSAYQKGFQLLGIGDSAQYGAGKVTFAPGS